MTMTATAKLSVVALALCAAPSRAAPVLDAFYAGGSAEATTYAFRLNSVVPVLAETFTAATSGTLTSYGLYLVPVSGAAATVTVALTTTAGGSPAGGIVLAQRSFETGAVTVPGFYDFDVAAAGVQVAAGSAYALVATVQTASLNIATGLGGDFPDSYAGGRAYSGQPGALQAASQTALFFRTFVDAAPVATFPAASVPEPASVALLGLGLLGAAGAVCRRRPGGKRVNDAA